MQNWWMQMHNVKFTPFASEKLIREKMNNL
jgi:hypothetical protein